MTTKKTDKKDAVAQLAELIQGIKVTMMTTVEPDGCIRSRPMWTHNDDFKGELWFFTHESAPKVDEVQADQHVNLAYSDASRDRYVSVSGVASVVRDRQKIHELWNPALKAWFPKGVDDPDIALICVKVNKAEYWDTPNKRMVQLIGFVKAVLTGEKYSPGEHQKIDLENAGDAMH
jgi:general stress protein 26